MMVLRDFDPSFAGKCRHILISDFMHAANTSLGTAPGETVDIAIVKIPAKVPITDSRYGGPIFINPGGPGGSGTQFAAFGGGGIQRLTDSAGTGDDGSGNEVYHDIIGFDPRGVAATTPNADCFDDDVYRRIWWSRLQEEGYPGSSNAALGRILSLNKALSATCNLRSSTGPSILNYMSTAFVARDMLELATKEAEWRQNTLRDDRTHAVSTQSDLVKKETKLDFWGFSYGTLLGATFASMFPDNVGKMILDGVLEPSDFVNHHWTGSVEDTEKALQSFYDYCAAAGPFDGEHLGQRCALASNGSTAADVRERLQGILMRLYHNPMWFVSLYGPNTLTYSNVKAVIFSCLYSPVAQFTTVAAWLAAIERDDKPFVAELANEHGWLPSMRSTSQGFGGFDAGMAVECTDTDSFEDLDIDFWQYTTRELNAVSNAGGPLLTSLHLRCAGWNSTAYRFAGPFGGKTATPILWIGNTADPICPLKSARNQAKRFDGSVVLQHDATGHCSLAAYSKCTIDAVRAYFRNATLPAPDTICPVSEFPFGVALGNDIRVQAGELDTESRVLMQTSRGLNELYHELGVGYGMPTFNVGGPKHLVHVT